MTCFCCTDLRISHLKGHPALNGIHYLEVVDDQGMPGNERQKTLLIHFVNPFKVLLKKENLRIDGGERIRNIKVTGTSKAGENILKVRLNKRGDFSFYTLLLVKDADDPESESLDEFDPMLSSITFSFKVACGSEFDCSQTISCAAEPDSSPEINYLAKDYSSFRQLILDRLSLVSPGWTERNPADLGMALVDMLAHVGDYLSYQQDAIATEAYLGTARRRISLRRHARLVDYFLNEGCNARTFVQIQVNADHVKIAKSTQLLTRTSEPRSIIKPVSPEYEKALSERPVVFETKHDVTLFSAHNQFFFYTWGARSCCLVKGSIKATLSGHFPNLKAGDILVFVEVHDPETGDPASASPLRRHAIRLTHVVLSKDPLGGRFLKEPDDNPVPVTEIKWDIQDALPFAMVISGMTDESHGSKYLENVSIACGNVVLADHGRTMSRPEELGRVPEPTLFKSPGQENPCLPYRNEPVPARFNPGLKKTPLTHAIHYPEEILFVLETKQEYLEDLGDLLLPVDMQKKFEEKGVAFAKNLSIQGSLDEWSLSDGNQAFVIRKKEEQLNCLRLPDPANPILNCTWDQAEPAIMLYSDYRGDEDQWYPQRDLLKSGPDANDFVTEIESDGTVRLRFGDGSYGKRPAAGTAFRAVYRVGNGSSGNIGAGTLAHIVHFDNAIQSVSNLLPAQGGMDPETSEHIRQSAPAAFTGRLSQERAVTPDDYATLVQSYPGVQKAAATFRWTGSWRTVFITVDRLGGRAIDAAFKKKLLRYLEKYRMAGHDIEIDSPRYVSLEMILEVCIKPDFFRNNVKAVLMDLFSNKVFPNGRLGLFHPDSFTLGQDIYVSPFLAVAQKVPGVASARIKTFKRQGGSSQASAKEGKLKLDRLEIARLDNDPNYPERGVFSLVLEGGM